MTKVKIFISSDLYFGHTTGYLFGYITTQSRESITFYLLRSCCIDMNSDGDGQLCGEICDINECKDRGERSETNFVQFVRQNTNNILLNRIIVNRNPIDVPIETVQIILYDHAKWMEATEDLCSAETSNEDCIKSLSFFIHKEFNEERTANYSSSRWNVKYVQIVVDALLPVLKTNKLAVVKHMKDWCHCLNSGLHRKYVVMSVI